jgi:hypothetical protein
MSPLRSLFATFTLVTGLGAVGVLSAHAGLTPYDAPSLSCVSSGQFEVTLKACAGASGAPAGITVQWEEKSIFDQYGWLSSDDPRLCALSLSGQPSLQHPGASRWELGPNECQEILIGDINFDETGVSGANCGLDPLKCGTDYVFRSFAHAGRGFGRSDWSADQVCSTQPCPSGGCNFTQGYWKTHGPVGCTTGNNTDQWPVNTLTLGSVSYTDVQLCSILNTPAGGNGMLSLAHQLIAAKLNLAGGSTCSDVLTAIVNADILIGNRVAPPVGAGSLSPGQTSGLIMTLDEFNNGVLAGCPAHCASSLRVPAIGVSRAAGDPVPSTWGSLKATYR